MEREEREMYICYNLENKSFKHKEDNKEIV